MPNQNLETTFTRGMAIGHQAGRVEAIMEAIERRGELLEEIGRLKEQVEYWRVQYFNLFLKSVQLVKAAGHNQTTWALTNLHPDFQGAGVRWGRGESVDYTPKY